MSASCSAGTGDGIAAGSSGWVTLTLPAGRYELVGNEPNHHADGIWQELDGASGAEFNRMWLTMMIAHHQWAVTMAQDVLATTSNADIKDRANTVVEGQNNEIATMPKADLTFRWLTRPSPA